MGAWAQRKVVPSAMDQKASFWDGAFSGAGPQTALQWFPPKLCGLQNQAGLGWRGQGDLECSCGNEGGQAWHSGPLLGLMLSLSQMLLQGRLWSRADDVSPPPHAPRQLFSSTILASLGHPLGQCSSHSGACCSTLLSSSDGSR